jgi:excinuclease UvrABC ATPase subunit
MEIKIEIREFKDGSLRVMFKGKDLGELTDIKVTDELNTLVSLMKLNEEIKDSNDFRTAILNEIQNRLAKLLAWYYTES